MLFAGGLSLAEYETPTAQALIAAPQSTTVHYLRGPDMGGGVGGMLYSVRGSELKYSISNGRGDIVAQSNANAEITWTASYEAYGKRPKETGSNADKQRANSKDEDPTGLLNEGFRYRDIETGMFMSRDPAGFVDGPNLYAYVKQNPWTAFDPEGLEAYVNVDDSNPKKVIVFITIPITYTGDTRPERIANVNKGIRDAWTGKFGRYKVDTKVVTPKDPKVGNTVELSTEEGNGTQNPSWVRRDGKKWDTGNWKREKPKVEREVAGHEAGHLMDLDDRYKDVGKTSEGKRKIEYTDPEASENIMGNASKKANENDIKNIILRGKTPPSKEPVEPAKTRGKGKK